MNGLDLMKGRRLGPKTCEMFIFQPVGIHCRQGRGRSGVMAACYLVRFQDLPPERAIINLRLQRPGSIETSEQERAVVHFHDCIRGVKGIY